MAKAILVMDMPETCNECFFYNFDVEIRKEYCSLEGCLWKVDTDGDKPDWCPLIPEPKRRKPGDAVEFTEGEPLTDELADKIFNFGFNECLAVIEEMAEEGKENE